MLNIKDIPDMLRKLAHLVAEPTPMAQAVVDASGEKAVFLVKEGYNVLEQAGSKRSVEDHRFYSASDLGQYLEEKKKDTILMGPNYGGEVFTFEEKVEHGGVGLFVKQTAAYIRLMRVLGQPMGVPAFYEFLRDMDGCFAPLSENGPDAGEYLLQQLANLRITKSSSTSVKRASNGCVLSVEGSQGTEVSAQLPDRIRIEVQPACEFDVTIGLGLKVNVSTEGGLSVTLSCPDLRDDQAVFDRVLAGEVGSVLPKGCRVYNGAVSYDHVPSNIGTPGKLLSDRGY